MELFDGMSVLNETAAFACVELVNVLSQFHKLQGGIDDRLPSIVPIKVLLFFFHVCHWRWLTSVFALI